MNTLRMPATIIGLILLTGVLAPSITYAAEDAMDKAIRTHRMGDLVIRTQPGATVRVTQLRHEFWFGTAIAGRMFGTRGDAEQRKRYLEILKANFNSAVHENAMKWYSTERREGEVSYATADRMLAWCEANGLPMRGHCLVWAEDRYVQDWIKLLDDAALRRRVEGRITEVVGRYRGRIGEYDVNNEMMRKRFYAERLGDDVRVKMFQWARAADPKAVLYVNDYGALVEGPHTEMYAAQVEGLVAGGAPVGGIGCQGHFSEQWPPDPKVIKKALDRLGKLGLPIKVTEYDMDTEDEQRKAKALVDVYRTCFAHPAVDGILMWGFWEGAHWRPKAALWRKDFTPTPAAEAYRDLVFNQWWTRYEGKADAQGVCRIRAFYGRHHIEADDQAREVELPKAAGQAAVDFTRDDAATTPKGDTHE